MPDDKPRRLSKREREVLIHISDGEEWSGSEIANELSEWHRSAGYVALARLQRDGMITARWSAQPPEGTRLFKITPLGQKALIEQRTTVDDDTRFLGGDR